MPVSGSVIVAPVSIDDVRRVLGDSSRDVGTLCKSNRVNMWSKKKPIRHNKIGVLTDAEFKAAAYGLYFDPQASYRIEWTYQFPTGGISSPCRLSDFDGYNHTVKSGLQFTSDNYSKDIIKSSSGVEVALYTDPNMITLKDFIDTLFAGCKVRISVEPYDGQTTYSYQTEYEDIAESSLKWTIPRGTLVKLNVGRSTVNAQIIKPNGVIIYPLIKDITFLSITADTGVKVTNWNSNMNVGTNINDMHPASSYQPGVSTYTLDASNGKDIFFNLGAIKNESGQTISSANVFVQMSYIDTNGTGVQKRINLYKGSSLGIWSLANGSTAADYFGIRHENIPSLANSTAVMFAIQINITFNDINGTYTITDTLRMITKNT